MKPENYLNIDEGLIVRYVSRRFPKFKPNQDEFVVRCPFNKHENDATKPAMNINRYTGQFFCFKCGAKGNLITLAKHFGDNLKNFN